MLSAGTKVGPYEVVVPLGAGGMGEVYRARDTKLNRDVALKVLPEAFARDPARMARFQREAQVLASLNHPNIASIYGLEESGGVLALVMELVEGVSLKERIVGTGLAPPSLAAGTGEAMRPPQGVALQTDALLNLAIQIADGLDAAHQKGVVHRDIKPANILITTRGQVKILDFGLAKLTDPLTLSPRPRGGEDTPSIGAGEGVSPQETPTASLDLDALTSPGTALGTVAYMSPEQACGEDTDARTDLFSFGAVLYEMATGRMAFTGNTTAVIFDAILHKAPTPAVGLNPDLPADLERIINKALEKDREVRYQVAAEMRADLKRLKRDTDSARRVTTGADLLISADRVAASPEIADLEGLRQAAHAKGGETPYGPKRSVAEALERKQPTDVGPPALQKRRIWPLAAGGVMLLAAVLVYFVTRPLPPPRVSSITQITNDDREKVFPTSFAPMATDGSRLYFRETGLGGPALYQVSTEPGETVPVSVPLQEPRIADISPGHSRLLVSTLNRSLWVLPVPGGAPHRVGDLVAEDATWYPDGKRILYARGSDLFTANDDGTESRKLASVPGIPTWPRWAPDGSRLRFTLYDSKTNSNALWEVLANGTNAHALLPGWNSPAAECCGSWTPDGKYFVFQARREALTGTYAIRERVSSFLRADGKPVQLTQGPLDTFTPIPSTDGKRLYVVAAHRRGELIRYDSQIQQFVSYLGGISAEGLDFSRDGEWVAYVTLPEGSLWRSKLDGSERLQLTFPPMRVAALASWSPDGKRIAFSATRPGKPVKIYLISASGGNPKQVLEEDRTEIEPGWSPDGSALVFGRVPWWEPSTIIAIQMVDLRSHQVTTVPDSYGLFGPCWSPDGRYLAAKPADSHKLVLYDFATHKWEDLANVSAGYPRWSHDGKYLYFRSAIYETDPAIYRVRISDHKLENVVSLKGIRRAWGFAGPWSGLAPDDSPLLVRDIGTQEIYALNVDLP